MNRAAVILGIFFGMLVPPLQGRSQQPPVDDCFSSSDYRTAGVSYVVYSLQKQKVVKSYCPETSLTAASITKLLTTATALEMMGENHRFETCLGYTGQISDGVLQGDLVVVAGGDPTLGSEHFNQGKFVPVSRWNPSGQKQFLRQWAKACADAGIGRVEGRIILQRGLFDEEPVSPYWTWEDIGNYYATGITDVAIYDNMFRITLESDAPGSPVRVVSAEPSLPGWKLASTLVAASNSKDSAYVYGQPVGDEEPHYMLRGSIPANRKNFVIKAALPDAGALLAAELEHALSESGISVGNNVLEKNANDIFHLLNVYYSPTLGEIVKATNFKSNNMFAEYLLRWIAIKGTDGKRGASQRDGIAVMKDFWRNRGLDVEEWFLYDGCGLSPQTAFPALSLARLLVYMREKATFSRAFINSLPTAGKEGTVSGFGSSLPGVFKVKSGSMADVRNYAGYYRKDDGSEYVVVIFVNRALCSSVKVRRDMESFITHL